NNPSGPSATASRPRSPATANDSAASSTISSGSHGSRRGPYAHRSSSQRSRDRSLPTRLPAHHASRSPSTPGTTRWSTATRTHSNASSAISSTTPSPPSDPVAKSTCSFDGSMDTSRPAWQTTVPGYPSTSANESSNASSGWTPASPVTASGWPSPA